MLRPEPPGPAVHAALSVVVPLRPAETTPGRTTDRPAPGPAADVVEAGAA